MKLLWHWLVGDTLDVAVGLVQKVCLNCDESTCRPLLNVDVHPRLG